MSNCDNDCLSFIERHRNVSYNVRIDSVEPINCTHKFVGAQNSQETVIGIPNDATNFIFVDDNEIILRENLCDGLFKWTGGCLVNDNLFCFPRTSNELIKYNINDCLINYIPSNSDYSKEHHYGGAYSPRNRIYQPPRSTDHILAWNLDNMSSYQIPIDNNNHRYCCSVLCGDYIYFLPERNDKVIKFNINDESIQFIGDNIYACVYDAKVYFDGNIYGFSAYESGIIKIDTKTDQVNMIHTDIRPGSFGTKLGVNGHFYSIPGDSQYVWDFNPRDDSLSILYDIKDCCKAKYAGGVTKRNGQIVGVPAEANSVFNIIPSEKVCIPENIYMKYFTDFY